MVGGHGDRRVGVADPLAHDLEGYPGPDRGGGARVPQVVQADGRPSRRPALITSVRGCFLLRSLVGLGEPCPLARRRPIPFEAHQILLFVDLAEGFVLFDGEGEVGEAQECLPELEEVDSLESVDGRRRSRSRYSGLACARLGAPRREHVRSDVPPSDVAPLRLLRLADADPDAGGRCSPCRFGVAGLRRCTPATDQGG